VSKSIEHIRSIRVIPSLVKGTDVPVPPESGSGVVWVVAPLISIWMSLRWWKEQSYQDAVKYVMTSDLISPAYEIIKHKTTIPIVANIPHSSIVIAQDIRESLLLNDNELEQELLFMTDWYVDELFACISELGGVAIKFSNSRLVVDPERFLDNEKEIMASRGMGVIYMKTSSGRDLRKTLSNGEKDDLINRYYKPYHEAIELEVANMLNRFGKCLIIDCHSFPSKPLPYELNQDMARPDICLGTDPFHTPAKVTEIMEDCFRKEGLNSKRNMPFEGTYVPLKYLNNDNRVLSIMVEVNRKLYMHEVTGEKSNDFLNIQEVIASMTREIAHSFCCSYLQK
jgi:N-formylglutamate deformylase